MLRHKIYLYWTTIRYLKPSQIFWRLYYRFKPVRADLRPAPAPADLAAQSAWCTTPVSWLGNARFRFLNEEHELQSASDWNHSEWDKLWLYNLHYFDCLRQPDMPEADGNGWIARWIAENPPDGGGNGWEPYTLSLRIANWIKWHLSGRPLTGNAMHSLAVQLRVLMQRREKHLLANHYLANAKALVFGGSFFTGPEAETWLAAGRAIYQDQLPEQILADGGHFERSAMYHSIILEDLLDLLNIGALPRQGSVIGKMLDALQVLTGPDGKISLLNDAAFGIAPAPAAVMRYAGRLGLAVPAAICQSRDLPETGYARLQNAEWTLICDGAPVGPDYQPGHAHADTLSFELWHRTVRLLIDSGTSRYQDSAIRREQRGTAAHNTATVDDRNSSEVWGAHRVARRARVRRRAFTAAGFSAEHDGFGAVRHRRSWELRENAVVITDTLSGRGRHCCKIFWHFAPECELSEDNGRIIIRNGTDCFAVAIPEGCDCKLGSGTFSPEFGLQLSHPVLCWQYHSELPKQVVTEFAGLESAPGSPGRSML